MQVAIRKITRWCKIFAAKFIGSQNLSSCMTPFPAVFTLIIFHHFEKVPVNQRLKKKTYFWSSWWYNCQSQLKDKWKMLQFIQIYTNTNVNYGRKYQFTTSNRGINMIANYLQVNIQVSCLKIRPKPQLVIRESRPIYIVRFLSAKINRAYVNIIA